MFFTAIVCTSSSLKPASSSLSTIRASPSSTAGLNDWPRSVESTECSGPVARMFSSHVSHDTLPVCGVVKQRSSSAPFSASARWSSGPIDCDGNSGWVITIVRTPASTAASTTVKISSRLRWPVASTRSCRAIRSSTVRVSGSTPPFPSTTGTGSISIPCSRRSSWTFTHTGTLAPGGASRSCASFSESTVGNHTMRAPSRAAISTASGFMPPTARFREIAPSTSIPGTDARTTLARSAVEP